MNDASDCAPPVQDLDIEYIVRHQSYNLRPNQNDIALIRLKKEVTFEGICKTFLRKGLI